MSTISEDVFRQAAESFRQASQGQTLRQNNQRQSDRHFDIAGYLEKYGIPFKIKQHDAGKLFCLDTCLFDSGHGKDSAILQMPSGILLYKCFHDSCQGKTWQDARRVISGDEPLRGAQNDSFEPTSRPVGDIADDLCNTGGEGDGQNLGKIDHLKVAKEIIEQYGPDNLIYVSHLRIFRIWREQVWVEFDDRTLYQATINYLSGKTARLTKNVSESILDLTRSLLFHEGIVWDADIGVIPVLNGELAWSGGVWTLNPHVREHHRTTLIPVEYEPEAIAPRFEQFLREIFAGDADAAEKALLICEMVGYTLTTSCEYEKFILLIGRGANGKSVLLDVIRLLIGPGQVSAVQPDQMDNRFQRAHLHGKLANIVTEIKEGGEIADAALKAISSGELTTAEHKFKKPFDFQPFATCWFGTNHMPHTRDFSDALFRRALIVEFNRVFHEDEQDKHLKNKLAAELPGILRLALTAFSGVIGRGHFTIPESCKLAKEQWRIEADQVAQFIADCCVMDQDGSEYVGNLFYAYQAWAADAGIRKTLNKINFSKRLHRLGAQRERTSGVRLFKGIRLKSILDEEDM